MPDDFQPLPIRTDWPQTMRERMTKISDMCWFVRDLDARSKLATIAFWLERGCVTEDESELLRETVS
jgi:hypothetical protein